MIFRLFFALSSMSAFCAITSDISLDTPNTQETFCDQDGLVPTTAHGAGDILHIAFSRIQQPVDDGGDPDFLEPFFLEGLLPLDGQSNSSQQHSCAASEQLVLHHVTQEDVFGSEGGVHSCVEEDLSISEATPLAKRRCVRPGQKFRESVATVDIAIQEFFEKHLQKRDSVAEGLREDLAPSEAQRGVLSYLEDRKDAFCPEDHILQEVYKDKEATLLEDVVCLIYQGYNIEYTGDQYRLCTAPLPTLKRTVDARQLFSHLFKCQAFVTLSLPEQTYLLYQHAGCRHVSIGVVALFDVLARSTRSPSGGWCISPKKLYNMLILRQNMLQCRVILSAPEYKELFCGMTSVRSEDIARIRESFKMYIQGKELLASSEKVTITQNLGAQPDKEQARDVLRCLQEEGSPWCGELLLKERLVTDGSRSVRVLYKAIVLLRSEGRNIMHDVQLKQFKLMPGVRVQKFGDYAKVLWSELSDPRIMKKGAAKLFLDLSDRGYNPTFSAVEDVLFIKKLSSPCSKKKLKSDDALQRQLWEAICQDKRVYDDQESYAKRSAGPIVWAGHPSLIKRMKHCWHVYNRVVFGMNPRTIDVWREFLQRKGEHGVSFDQLYSFFGTQECKVVWECLSGMMRSGYAGNITIEQQKVYWDEKGTDVERKSIGLLERVCAIPEDQDAGEATCAMHKEGYLSVTPWDVRRILDVLVCVGRRQSGAFDGHAHQLWKAGLQPDGSVPGHMSMTVYRLSWLHDQGILERLKNAESVSFEPILTKEFWICDEENAEIKGWRF